MTQCSVYEAHRLLLADSCFKIPQPIKPHSYQFAFIQYLCITTHQHPLVSRSVFTCQATCLLLRGAVPIGFLHLEQNRRPTTLDAYSLRKAFSAADTVCPLHSDSALLCNGLLKYNREHSSLRCNSGTIITQKAP
ncbi:uncharacterized protein ACNS7B_021002 [Menidia menidia]